MALTITDMLTDIVSAATELDDTIDYDVTHDKHGLGLKFKIARPKHPIEGNKRGRASTHLVTIAASDDPQIISLDAVTQTLTQTGVEPVESHTDVPAETDLVVDALVSTLHTMLDFNAEAQSATQRIQAEKKEQLKKEKEAAKAEKSRAERQSQLKTTPGKPSTVKKPSVHDLRPGMYIIRDGRATQIQIEPRKEVTPSTGTLVALTGSPHPNSVFAAGHMGYVCDAPLSAANTPDGCIWVSHAGTYRDGSRPKPEAIPHQMLYDVSHPHHDLVPAT